MRRLLSTVARDPRVRGALRAATGHPEGKLRRALSAGVNLGLRLRFTREHAIRPDEWGLVLPMHLGDTYFACALAEALRATHGGSRVTAFVKPGQRYIATLFPGIDRIVDVSDAEVMWRASVFAAREGVPFCTLPPKHLGALLGFKGFTILDLNRAWQRLPLDAPLASPRHPSADEATRAAALFDAHGLPPGRTVLLAPESNTVAEYSLDAWGALADALRQAGWTPVTNGGPKGYAVPGTARVDIPLDVCIAFVERGGWLVTMRTGLADVVSSARARITVFYPPPPPGLLGPVFDRSGAPRLVHWYAAFSLVGMGLNTHAEEYELDEAGLLGRIPEIAAAPPSLAHS